MLNQRGVHDGWWARGRPVVYALMAGAVVTGAIGPSVWNASSPTLPYPVSGSFIILSLLAVVPFSGLGVLFGSQWPDHAWRWGLWLTLPLLILVLAGLVNPNRWFSPGPTIGLIYCTSLIGSCLGGLAGCELRKHPLLRGVGLAIVAVLAVLAAVSACAISLQLPSPPLGAVKAFYDAVATGTYEQAYLQVHPALQAEQPVEELANQAQNLTVFFAESQGGVQRVWTTARQNGITRVEGEVTTGTGTAVTVRCWLAEHDGTWKIIAYTIEGAPYGRMQGGTMPRDQP